MAVKIDIPGIGEVQADNAASEQTLREILKALGGRPGQIDGQGGGGAGGAGVGPEAKKASQSVKKLGTASKDGASAINKMASAASSVVGGAFNLIVGTIGTAAGAVTGLATGLLEGKNSIHEFTKNVPGLNLVTGVIENQMNQFKELSSIGAGFGNNMFEITQVAGQSALSMQTLAKVIATNSEPLRLFGASVQDGTRRFGRLSKELRTGDLGRQLLGMGVTTDELNENLINYNELMVSTGRDRFMTDQQLAQGAAEYSLELDRIARLTGKSRKQLEEEMKSKNTDIRRQAAMSTMTTDQMNKFRGNLEQAAAKSPEFEAALVDMADGIANDPVTQQLMANSPTFKQFAKDIENMDAAEFNNFQKKVGEEMKALALRFKDGGIDAAMNSTFGSALQIAGQLATTVETTKSAIDNEQSARDKLTTAVGNSVTTLEDLSGRSQALLTGTDAFKEAAESIADLIPDYNTAVDLFEANKGTIETAMNDAWNWLKTDGKKLLDDAIKFSTEAFNKAVEYMGKILPTLKQWADDFAKDPAGFFNSAIDSLTGFVTNAMLILGGGIVAWFSASALAAKIGVGLAGLGGTIGTAVLGFISTALTASAGFIATALATVLTAAGGALLSLPVLIGGAITAAIVAVDFAFFDGEMTKWVTDAISDLWGGIKNWMSGAFEGIKSFFGFGGGDPGSVQGSNSNSEEKGWFKKWWEGESNEQKSEETSENNATGSVTPTKPETTSEPSTELAMLNTNMLQLIELTKKNTTAVKALNGNIMAG